MIQLRTAVLLAGVVLATVAVPSHADGVTEAAITSFTVDTATGYREVEIVASRGTAGDALLMRIEDCVRSSCSSAQTSMPLAAGQLTIEAERAELRTIINGRRLQVSWALAGDGFTLQSGRFESDGRSGSTTFDGTAGRTAAVKVVLDGTACATSGSLGRSVQVHDGPSDKAVTLGAGPLLCNAMP